MTDEEDCWDAFGSSSDEDEDEDTDDGGNNSEENTNGIHEHNNSNTQTGRDDGMDTKAASVIAMHLSQTFVKHNPQVRLSDRIVAVVRVVVADTDTTKLPSTTNDECNNNKCTVSKHLEQRQIRVFKQNISSEQLQQLQQPDSETTLLSTIFGTLDTMVDALIILENTNSRSSNPITDTISPTTTTTTTTTNSTSSMWIQELVESILCPGGVLIVSSRSSSANGESTNHTDDDSIPKITTKKDGFEEQLVGGSDAITVLCSVSSSSSSSSSPTHWIARCKKTIRVHASTCPWLSSSHSVVREEERLHLATVALSSHEMASLPFSSSSSSTTNNNNNNNNNHRRQIPRTSSKLTENSIRKAVTNMNQYGYCVLPGILDTNECLEWGSTVLDCIHEASKILLDRDGVDIYNPHSSHTEPQSYRELSMREDLRMDLRHGPALSKLRARKEGSSKTGGNSILLSASEDHYGDGLFLRGHRGLLEILRRTMNPGSSSSSENALEGTPASSNSNSKPLYLGNIGRWNFGGTGNNGTYQDLRISPVGGIVSLPGSADQALHADTPHLFEHLPDLPAHYVNMFAPCTAFENTVGGTAFVHGSHDLAFTAKHYDATNNASFYPFLVRPRVSLGDVILFDCRILHFGLANISRSTERCICYVNTWHDWFHDAKNWDKNRAIFDEKDDEDDGTKQEQQQ